MSFQFVPNTFTGLPNEHLKLTMLHIKFLIFPFNPTPLPVSHSSVNGSAIPLFAKAPKPWSQSWPFPFSHIRLILHQQILWRFYLQTISQTWSCFATSTVTLWPRLPSSLACILLAPPSRVSLLSACVCEIQWLTIKTDLDGEVVYVSVKRS